MTRPSASDLGKLPLFGGLSEEALRAFADQAEVVRIAPGELVFAEHEPARRLFVLEGGALEVVRRTAAGRIVQLHEILPGESFGEMSFIDMQPRSATVRAVETSVLWAWAYASFHERYCKDSKCYTLLVMNMARELSRRLRRADDRIVTALCEK